MGWAIANACGLNDHPKAIPTNYLEIYVSSSNKNAFTQIENFVQYIEKNSNGLKKDVKFININDIRIRYYDNTGKMKEIYQGNDLSEDKYENIITQIYR